MAVNNQPALKKNLPAGQRLSADGKRVLRTWDPNLAANIQTNTGKTLQELGTSNRPLVNQQSIGASDEQYSEVLKNQRANAQNRRNAAAAAETTGASLDDRQKFMQAEMSKMNNNDRSLTSQIAERSARNKPLPGANVVTPTPQKPMVPISAQGQPAVEAPALSAPTISAPAVVGDTQLGAAQQPSGGLYGGATLEQYNAMSPEEQLRAKSQMFDEYGRMRVGQQEDLYGAQDTMLANREADAAEELATRTKDLTTQAEEDVNAFKEDQAAQVDEAERAIQDAADKRSEQAATSLAFQGFGRSTKAAEIQDSIRQDTQAQVADIERQSNRIVSDYQVSSLEKVNAEVEKYKAKVDRYGDARDELALNNMQKQADLMTDLFKQNPMNPENMIATADKVKAQQMEMAKLAIEEQKEINAAASKNFTFMTDKFGSEWVNSLSEEARSNYAYAMGVPPSVLASVGKTQAEISQEWDQLKYVDSQNFEMQKMMTTNQLQIERDVMSYNQDLAKLGVQQNFDWAKMEAGFKFDTGKLLYESDQKNQAVLNKWGVSVREPAATQYADQAAGGNQNGTYYEQPIPHPNANTNVVAINSKLAQAYPDGYKFKASAGAGGLGGQCKWFSQQITTLENGQGWTGGSSVPVMKSKFANYKKNGQAYSPGEEEPKVGQTILTTDSKKYGHSATINAITPDGKLVLTESNYKGPLTVSNTRIVDANDPKIVGYLKTIPRSKYQLDASQQKKITGGAGAALNAIIRTNIAGIGDLAGLGEAAKKSLPYNQQMEQEANQTIDMENIIQNNPMLSSIASGAIKPSAEDISELQRVAPELIPAYQEAVSRSQSIQEQVKPTEVRQIRQELANNAVVKNAAVTTQQYKTANNLYKQLAANPNMDTSIVDNALIKLMVKADEPNSAVMAGEYDQVTGGRSAAAQVQMGLQRLQSGGQLTSQERDTMMQIMFSMAKDQSNQLQNTLDSYVDMAERQGINPDDILGTYTSYYQ